MLRLCPVCGHVIRVLATAETYHCRRCGDSGNVEYLVTPKSRTESQPEGEN